ncbi:hypothetical protein [Falsibacillus pallidus]|uniref:Uncharacterized protein n=1 Tax=Falsibacillus pallidus TaxID=493781 RepID=A0A370GEX1_9BACI|nr:hypothetical protein [Falsibacillus pallidus]RDI42227.1 hypothetical protein DFR59_10566 [Falsibacillus pallidus]
MKRIFAAAVIIVVLIMGAYLIDGLLNTEPPKPTITVDGKNAEVAQGSYCWKGLFSGSCADMISPLDMAKNLKLTIAKPGSKVKVEFRKKPINDIGGSQWVSGKDTKEVIFNGNTFTVPDEKGNYAYIVYAMWKQGTGSFVFTIEVK